MSDKERTCSVEVVKLTDLIDQRLVDHVARALFKHDPSGRAGNAWIDLEEGTRELFRGYARSALAAFIEWQQRN